MPLATAEARVPTEHASRYLQQLCKHWSHNLAVSFNENAGRVTFPADARGASWPGDATVDFVAEDAVLVVTISASAAGQRDGLEGAVARHLDRFAFREAPLSFDWARKG